MFDDVIDDVTRGVVDAAGFADFGFFFDSGGLACAAEGDDFAEKAFVDLAEDVGGEDGEFVGAFGRVEVFEDGLELAVADGQAKRDRVGVFSAGFGLEVEQAGVVLGIRGAEAFLQAVVDVRAVGQGQERAGLFDAAVFADAQEDDAVDDELDRVVELALGEVLILTDQVLSEVLSPAFELIEEDIIDIGGAFCPALRRVLVKCALLNRFGGQQASDFVPLLRNLVVGEVVEAGGVRFVVCLWRFPTVVKSELSSGAITSTPSSKPSAGIWRTLKVTQKPTERSYTKTPSRSAALQRPRTTPSASAASASSSSKQKSHRSI